MKTRFFLITALICFSTTGFSELTIEDLEKIRQINKETEVRLEKRISEQGERLSADIKTLGEAQGQRLDYHGQLILALIVAILAFVATPLGIILYLMIRRSREQDEKIDVSRQEQAAENQKLQKKIDELESRQAFRP